MAGGSHPADLPQMDRLLAAQCVEPFADMLTCINTKPRTQTTTHGGQKETATYKYYCYCGLESANVDVLMPL